MNTENVESFFHWINERHSIYLKRKVGPAPFTEDEILQRYKFTNPFRENDRVTIWMRQNWTNPHKGAPICQQIYNICLFRMFGTPEFAEAVGWQTEFNPTLLKSVAREKLNRKEKVFTGAYIITNQGLKLPKEEVVVDLFLEPVWQNSEHLAEVAGQNSLESMHKTLGKLRGWGGGGFMAYEAVTDMNYTPVLAHATDKMTWANAGPGAKRGLNRIHDRKLTNGRANWNQEMRNLLLHKDYYVTFTEADSDNIDMRCIEHSLCEWDKYERVRLGQGRPRSKVSYNDGEWYPVN
jgi:hypothetical protein|tara:strand:+ start:4975 stop:5853 length:879 start_codon:yes stop_codon:yes gene_type:complete